MARVEHHFIFWKNIKLDYAEPCGNGISLPFKAELKRNTM